MDSSRRTAAAWLAFVLGGVGAHKFYLGRTRQGVLYLLFFWTFVPTLLSIAEGLYYLALSDETFEATVAPSRSLLWQLADDVITLAALAVLPRGRMGLAPGHVALAPGRADG